MMLVTERVHLSTTNGTDKKTKFRVALEPEVTSREIFSSRAIRSKAYYHDDRTLIFCGDAGPIVELLAAERVLVNCIVTSPPFYGQRDYGVRGQIGLERHPAEYLFKLVEMFRTCKRALLPTGSLWVNMGDTYWSGKGQHRSDEKKQSARRFGLRPQDRTGDGLWCRPKQLLLMPHRFAIAMQESGWVVRNDNVWIKPNPIPDQVNDRCSMSHEYVFHFVRERWYYFDRQAIGRSSPSGAVLPPFDTWTVPPSRGNGSHKASFSEELIDIPIRATTPSDGIVLDPFAGSGTTIRYARALGFRVIGVDLKSEFCALMVRDLKNAPTTSEQVKQAHRNIQQGQRSLNPDA